VNDDPEGKSERVRTIKGRGGIYTPDTDGDIDVVVLIDFAIIRRGKGGNTFAIR